MRRLSQQERSLSLVVESGSDWESVEKTSNESGSDWPLWLTVTMVARHLSLGKTKIYELIELANLPAIRVGRAVRVPTARFLKWVEEFEKQSFSA